MRVSVVICAYTVERWDDLVAAVTSCADQTRAPDEIAVVIDYNDELLERARSQFPHVIVVANTQTKGLSGARNTGVAATSGDVIAFLDDDARAAATWLEELTRPLDDRRVAGVGGWVVPGWPGDAEPAGYPATFMWVLGCSYEGLPADGASIRNPIGASMVLRRAVFQSIGGFTSGLGRIGKTPLGCEETELCIRYTTAHPDERFVLARRAVVVHHVPPARVTLHYFVTRCYGEGLSKAMVSRLVGRGRGLESERSHLARAVPREFLESLGQLPSRPATGGRRAALLVTGVVATAFGYARGRVALRAGAPAA